MIKIIIIIIIIIIMIIIIIINCGDGTNSPDVSATIAETFFFYHAYVISFRFRSLLIPLCKVGEVIECFHMTSRGPYWCPKTMKRRPYWCPKTMKRRPCWCPKSILWELNSFLMQTLSFVPINLHRCWPRE